MIHRTSGSPASRRRLGHILVHKLDPEIDPELVAETSVMVNCTQPARTYTSHRSHKCESQITLKNAINICTYNTRTLFEEHFDNFMEELEPIDNKPQINWDIIGLSETKLKDSFNTTTTSNHMLFNSGVDINEKRANGVGFLIHSKLANCVSAFNNFSERICLIKLQKQFNNTNIIQVYAPSTSHDDDEVEQFYEQLQELTDTVPRRDELFIMGDFNGKVGGIDEPGVVGPHSNVARGYNARGERLVNFCKQNDLFITNTCFQHRRKYTWISPGDRVKNTIDYILTRKNMRFTITDSCTVAHPDISDHRLVRCKVKLENFVKCKKPVVTPRFDVAKLKSPGFTEQFATCVTENLEDSDNVQGIMDNIENALKTASITVLGKKNSNINEHWITQETKDAVAQKRSIRLNSGVKSIEYKLAKSTVKKLCKIDKEKAIERDHAKMAQLSSNQQYFEAMKHLKLSKQKPVKGWAMKDSQNNTVHTVEEILETWASFYEKLYKSDRTTFTKIEEDPNDPIPPVTVAELESAIHKLKKGKAPGPDSITAEMLEAGGKHLHTTLLKLIDLIILTRDVPEQMNISEIITLFKKGDRLECSNYRPISLLSHVYKLVMQIIYSRISGSLMAALPRNQAAYQRGRSTIEQIQSLQQLIEKYNEYNINATICFIDYTKAFDSIDQQKLWNALRKYTDVQPAYINLLATLYESSKARVRTDIGTTRLIDILRGVKQGDLASAVLFCIALMVIMIITFEDFESGVSVGGEMLSDKGYADDFAIIADTVVKMRDVLSKLAANSKDFGLSINIPKTRGMLIGNHPPDTIIYIDRSPLKMISIFDYLGRRLSNDADDTPAVKYRIGIGWDAFKKVQSIITSRHVSMRHKALTYETYVRPAVLYASETMTWKKDLLQRMEVFQNHILRWMTRCRLIDHIPLRELRRRTNIKTLSSHIIARKLKWYGHVKRSQLPVKVTVEGLVEGKRKRGRPRRRWRDDIRDWTGQTWQELNRLSQNRKAWRKIVYETQSANAEEA